MEMITIKDFEFACPPSGAIIEWRKSGAVWAYALFHDSSGLARVVRCPDYDAAASVCDYVATTRHLIKRTGYGAHWIDADALRTLARSSVDAIDADLANAEREAESVIAFYRDYLAGDIESYMDWRTREQRAAAHADGWVSFMDSTCYPVKRMRDYGSDPTRDSAALSMALLRRGYVVLFAPDGWSWRLTDPITASIAMLAEAALDLVRSCNSEPHRRGQSFLTEESLMWSRAIRTRVFDRIVDRRAEERALWADKM